MNECVTAVKEVVTVEFERQFLNEFIQWVNEAKILNPSGMTVELSVDEYAPGRAVLVGRAHSPEVAS